MTCINQLVFMHQYKLKNHLNLVKTLIDDSLAFYDYFTLFYGQK